MKTVIEIIGSQLSKKEHILKKVTDFLASGPIFSHFLQSTAANENSSFFNWNIFFSQSFIGLLEAVLFYSEFFPLVETIIETWGKSIFQDEIYSC